MALDELSQRNAHLLLDGTRVHHVARDVKQLCARIARPAQRREPVAASPQNRRRHGDRLDVRDGRRTAEQTDLRGERRLQARLPLFPLQRLDQSLDNV